MSKPRIAASYAEPQPPRSAWPTEVETRTPAHWSFDESLRTRPVRKARKVSRSKLTLADAEKILADAIAALRGNV